MPSNTGTHLLTLELLQKNGGILDSAEGYSPDGNVEVIPKPLDGAPDPNDTFSQDNTVECISLSETESVLSTDSTNLEKSGVQGPGMNTDKQNPESSEIQQKTEELVEPGRTESECLKLLHSCEKELASMRKENKKLEHQFKELLTQSELLRNENEKLIDNMNLQKQKHTEISENLEKATKKCEHYKKELQSVTTHYEKETRTLSAKLADETAAALSLEEENKKLKTKLEKLFKEKTELVGQMSRSTGASDMIEEKIENGFRDLTDLFLKEISALKNQYDKSANATTFSGILPSLPTQQPCHSDGNRNALPEQRAPAETDQRRCRVFIAGDSTTRILSKNRMSDNSLDVKIKSHPGGKLQDIHNTIIAMAENDDEYMCNTGAVIIHAGTNQRTNGPVNAHLRPEIYTSTCTNKLDRLEWYNACL